MEIVNRYLPKDLVYLVQDYAKDRRYYNRTIKELLERSRKATMNTRFCFAPWTDTLQYIFMSKSLFDTYINDVLKHKSWSDPYYYELSDDNDYDICPIGDCTNNCRGNYMCFKHYKKTISYARSDICCEFPNFPHRRIINWRV